MRLITDIMTWVAVWFFVLSGAARALFDGAFFAYFRPQWEAMIEQLPEFVRWFLP